MVIKCHEEVVFLVYETTTIYTLWRVFLAPGQNGHSAGKSEAAVDIARTNHLAVFDIATNSRRLNIGAWRLIFLAWAARVSFQQALFSHPSASSTKYLAARISFQQASLLPAPPKTPPMGRPVGSKTANKTSGKRPGPRGGRRPNFGNPADTNSFEASRRSSSASSFTAASHHANATDANAPLALEPALEVPGSTILCKHVSTDIIYCNNWYCTDII